MFGFVVNSHVFWLYSRDTNPEYPGENVQIFPICLTKMHFPENPTALRRGWETQAEKAKPPVSTRYDKLHPWGQSGVCNMGLRVKLCFVGPRFVNLFFQTLYLTICFSDFLLDTADLVKEQKTLQKQLKSQQDRCVIVLKQFFTKTSVLNCFSQSEHLRAVSSNFRRPRRHFTAIPVTICLATEQEAI